LVWVAHLLGLQVYSGRFETSQHEDLACCFLKTDTSWVWAQCTRVQGGFPQVRGPRCCRVPFWLMFYLLLMEREKKGGVKWPGGFFPRADTPSWLCHCRVFLAVSKIKGCFKGQSLNFVYT
jgi:hypothetical protein